MFNAPLTFPLLRCLWQLWKGETPIYTLSQINTSLLTFNIHFFKVTFTFFFITVGVERLSVHFSPCKPRKDSPQSFLLTLDSLFLFSLWLCLTDVLVSAQRSAEYNQHVSPSSNLLLVSVYFHKVEIKLLQCLSSRHYVPQLSRSLSLNQSCSFKWSWDSKVGDHMLGVHRGLKDHIFFPHPNKEILCLLVKCLPASKFLPWW